MDRVQRQPELLVAEDVVADLGPNVQGIRDAVGPAKAVVPAQKREIQTATPGSSIFAMNVALLAAEPAEVRVEPQPSVFTAREQTETLGGNLEGRIVRVGAERLKSRL